MSVPRKTWTAHTSAHSPETGDEPEEEEESIALDEGGDEGEDGVDGQGDDQALPPAHLVSQSSPHERSQHHAQVHYQSCQEEKGDSRQGPVARTHH